MAASWGLLEGTAVLLLLMLSHVGNNSRFQATHFVGEFMTYNNISVIIIS